jgi:hypothetical protein
MKIQSDRWKVGKSSFHLSMGSAKLILTFYKLNRKDGLYGKDPFMHKKFRPVG